MDTNKEDTLNKIKEWLKLQQIIESKNKELKELKKNMKSLEPDLLNIMKSGDIDCIDCNNGQIKYTKKKVTKAINKKYLLSILSQYYGDNGNEICNIILENRLTDIKESINFKKHKI